jgi:uncharacterized protein (TIGR03437 family)
LEDFLNKSQYFLAASVWAAFVAASPASAQTPANITVVSGNGQLICPLCTLGGFGGQNFDGMYVKVTDASGNPVSGATVNWTLTAGSGALGNLGSTDQVLTDSSGIALERYIPTSQISGSINNPWAQSTITASLASGSSVIFYETQAFANVTGNGNGAQLVQVQVLTPSSNPSCTSCISPGDTLTGNAGSTSNVQFKVQLYAQGSTQPVVPNVSLRLISNQTSPSVSCATAAGADPGSVLTDSTGVAVCTAVIGPATGAGTFYALVGGVASVGFNQGGAPQGYFQTGNYNLNVLPGSPSSLQIVSGNNLSASPGQQVPGSLIAAVLDAAGNPLAGQNVVWTVSPSSSATLSATTTTSDASGHVQTNATLTSSASGQISVNVALASNPNISATFTITANVLITGLNIVSGNNQTALINTSFQSPLVVQLNSANGPASGIPVNFAITGPAVLSAGTATTDSTGKASVQVVAGGTTGAVTVTATSGTLSATFSLTVIPNGPSLTTNSFFNGADFQPGAISPCGIATIIAPGVAAAIQGTVAYDGVGALPYTLGGVQVTFSGAQAPIYNVANQNGQQQVTVQVPCSVVPGNVPVVVSVGGGTGTITIPVRPASPGLFLTQFNSTTAIPVLVRPDGSFVSPTNAAHRGETLIAYLTGMGANTPALATNSLPAPGSSPTFQGTIIIGMNGAGVPMVAATVSPDLVGVETVSFTVPAATPSGNSTFSVGIIPQGSSTAYYSSLGIFPVQ